MTNWQRDHLRLQCLSMLDERFHKACAYFDQGEYFEAHEGWEELWNEAHGARHAFLQCLIQVAVALHHGRNGNWSGARKLCASALGYLEKGRTDSEPVDLDRLKENILDLEIAIQKISEGQATSLPFFKLPLK